MSVRPPGIGIVDAHRDEIEFEVADAGEQAVQLCSVDHLADELGVPAAANEGHAVEGAGEPVAEPAPNRDLDAEGRFHLGQRIRPGGVSAPHAGSCSPRTI